MTTVLITGGAGFFGDLLKKSLLDKRFNCVSIDLVPDDTSHQNLVRYQGNVLDSRFLDRVFKETRPDIVFHCAAVLPHSTRNSSFVWDSNVEGTRRVAEATKQHQVEKLVYISTSALWGKSIGKPVTEQDTPIPVEIYGRSKMEAEKVLLGYRNNFHSIIFRCPAIIDEGRLGLLAILFEFINEDRKIWVLGEGKNRYQFLYGRDLVQACIMAIKHAHSEIINVGSDDVKSMREIYEHVIDKAGSDSKIASFPKLPGVLLLKLAYILRLSPLGAYQVGMLGEDFMFDNTRAKTSLGWQPSLANEEILYRAYEYYKANRSDIEQRSEASPHRSVARMGIIRLLKWLS